MQEIAFTKVKLPYGWLGNMSPHPIEYMGKRWKTAEALFQAMRFNNEEIIEKIRAEKSPFGAKCVAKKHREMMFVEPKSDKDIANMKLCIKLKLEQHPQLREELVKTGDAEIYEDVTARPRGNNLFWGAARLASGEKVGANVLGKIWMELRLA